MAYDAKTLVSVIIPSFEPVSFDTLLRSIDANAGSEFEWIVVDDGSRCNFDDIFTSLPEQVKLIRLPENRRQGAARNAGLLQAQGSWIKFLDADDALDSGHLDRLLSATNQGNAIPFASTRHIFENGTSYVNQSWRDLSPQNNAQYRRQLVRPFLHHCGALYPRKLLLELEGYDESLVTDEDGDLLLRILHQGYHFTPVEGIHYQYIHHSSGSRVSSDGDIAKMLARIRVCEKVVERFDEQVPSDIALALAQRMDKIAMTYWTVQPVAARELLRRASRLSPGYKPDMRIPLRVLRMIGGPRMVFAAQGLYRRLKGRPKGGTQG